MRWAWLAIVMLAPAASACTTTTPAAGTLATLVWEADDRLAFGVEGRWFDLDVASGAVAARDLPPQWAFDPPAPEPRRGAPDGSLHLEVRTRQAGMGWGPGCTSVPAYEAVGVDLVRASGTLAHRWGDGDRLWPGAAWGNDTHGFVWDHAASRLEVVSWETGAVERSSEVPLPGDTYPPSAVQPPALLGDRLVLPGSGSVAVLDPADLSVRVMQGGLEGPSAAWLRDGLVLFSASEQRDESVDWELAADDVATGQRLWHVNVSGGPYHWTRHGVVAIGEAGQSLQRWRGAERLPDLPLGSSAILAGKGDLTAVGVHEPEARLLVLGADLEPLVDLNRSELGLASPDVAGTGGDGGPGSTSSKGNTATGLGPAVLVAALAMMAVRRRLG